MKNVSVGALVRCEDSSPQGGFSGAVVDTAGDRLAVAAFLADAARAVLPVFCDSPLGEGVFDAADVRWVEALRLKPLDAALDDNALDRLLRARCEAGVRGYHRHRHAPRGGEVRSVPVSGKVYGAEEMVSLVDSALDFWLTTGRFNDAFEAAFAGFLGLRHVHTVNSGSSANLVALTALTSPKLGDRRLLPGDEVITVAAGFPTTVNPILQNGLVPVFLDVDLATCNVDASKLAAAVGPRTRAIMLAHTLGNPFDLSEVMRVAQKHDLWVVEDCCDALGSRYDGRLCGTFGHVATFSFYPAHHITMGEGGAVATNDAELSRLLVSFRDWGRDCWCPPGRDDTCRRRFSQKFGELPEGYDHKYVYSHVGYNLKITDMQAAVGLAQMARLPEFVEARKANFARIVEGLSGHEDMFLLPRATPGADPSWFGVPLTLQGKGEGRREDLMRHLNALGIGTRLLFGGNLLRQPYFRGLPHRVAGTLEQTDRIMRDTFWVGCYPGIGPDHIRYLLHGLTNWK